MSFFNAGYGKQEIEEAAKIIQNEKHQQKQAQAIPAPGDSQNATAPVKNATASAKNKGTVSSYGSQKTGTVSSYGSQKTGTVSSYESHKKNTKAILIIKIALSVLALGIIVFAFLFREELMDFINSFI